MVRLVSYGNYFSPVIEMNAEDLGATASNFDSELSNIRTALMFAV